MPTTSRPLSEPVRLPSSSWPIALRQASDDAGHDDQRDAVADAAAGDLLADPHQEQGAADEADGAGKLEQQARLDDRLMPCRTDCDSSPRTAR